MAIRNNSGRNIDQIPIRVILFVLFLAFLWGGNAIAVKIGLQQFAPLASAGARFLIAMILIGVWASWQGISLKPKPHELMPLFLMGLLFVSQMIFFNCGTHLTHAGRAAVMINTHPLFVALLAHVIVPGDRLTWAKALGLALAFAGILTVFGDNLLGENRGQLTGDLLILASAFQLGLTTVLTSRLVQHIDPHRLLLSQMCFGVPLFFLFSGIFEGKAGYGFSWPALLAILYQGVVVGGFCFVAWTTVLKQYSPSRLAVLFFTTPLWGIALGNLFLAEPITMGLGFGTTLVASGIYIVSRARRA